MEFLFIRTEKKTLPGLNFELSVGNYSEYKNIFVYNYAV